MFIALNPVRLVLWATILLLACKPSVNLAQDIDPVYGQELAGFYKSKGVKEVFVEREQFYNGELVYPRYLSGYILLNGNGQPIRQEAAHLNKIAYRTDIAYDEAGNKVSSVFYQTAPGKPGREGITWGQARRNGFVASGKVPAGEARWNPATGQWEQVTAIRTWSKNDTTYTETRKLYDPAGMSRDVSRAYFAGSDIKVLRTDYLTFSPKGMRESSYTYSRVENGRTTEYGNVDFETDLLAYLEKHPELGRYMFTEHGANSILDRVARQSGGVLKSAFTFTYNAAGHLVEKDEYGTRTTYLRHDSGHALTSRVVHEDNSGNTISYSYNEKGLLEKEVRKYLGGEPSETLYYRYTFSGR